MLSATSTRQTAGVSVARLGPAVILLVLCLAGGGLISLWMGQDINWDLKNYHLYNAWSYRAGRLNTDLFAAGIQTFFSPFLDMPYYFLSMGVLAHHPRLLAFLMGLPFGCLMFVSFQICWVVSGGFIPNRAARTLICLAAMIFGCSGIAVVVQIGATFNEVPIAALISGGVWLLLLHAQQARAWNRRSLSLTAGAGLLLGSAAALKFTAAIYAPGAGIICLLLPGRIHRRLIRAALFSAAWFVMIAILWGSWGVELYHLTGNPLFPMFNNIFHSNWAAPIGGRDLHAMPSGLAQAIFYPFYWIFPGTTVIELRFSDGRYAVAYGAACLFVVTGLVCRFGGARREPSAQLTDGQDRSAIHLVLYAVVTFAIWEAMFSILRYSAALESMSGAVVIVACCALYRCPQLPKAVKYAATAAVILISTASMAFSEYPSYGRVAYGRTVWSVHAPAVKPGATIILADQPMAFVAPFIAQTSPDVSFIGIPFYLDSAAFLDFRLGAQTRSRIANADHLYVVVYQTNIPPIRVLADFGVQIDFHACQYISSSISADMEICAAKHVTPGSTAIADRFSLLPVQLSQSKFLNVDMSFSNACANNTAPQKVTIRYASRQPIDGIDLYVQTPPGQPTPLSTGASSGTVKTGPWITGGQSIIFTDTKGDVLDKYALQYVPCD